MIIPVGIKVVTGKEITFSTEVLNFTRDKSIFRR